MKNTAILAESSVSNLRDEWVNLDDFLLVKGIFIHGYDNWKNIIEDRTLWCDDQNSYEAYLMIFQKIEKRNFKNNHEFDEKSLKSYKIISCYQSFFKK